MKSRSSRLRRSFEVVRAALAGTMLSIAALGLACAGVGSGEPETAATALPESEPATASADPPREDEEHGDQGVRDPETTGFLQRAEKSAAETRAEEEAMRAADAHLLEPPDGEWLIDEETGGEYFLVRLPKSRPWSWENEERTRIRYNHFELWDVVAEDEESFQVRINRIAEEPQVPVGTRDPEEVAAIAASYVSTTVEADVLELASFGRGLPTTGQWRNGFDIADMNGDGHLDIVHGPLRGGNTPVVILGDGTGSWRSWDSARFPQQRPYAYGDVGVADFDGDGHLDIALSMHIHGMLVLLGDGEGGFLPWGDGAGLDAWDPASRKPPGFSSRAIEIVDWNGDGRPDILALGEGPRPDMQGGRGGAGLIAGSFGVVLYINQGDGTWQRVVGDDESLSFGDSIALGDFNGDGRTDIATSSNTLGLRRVVHYGEEDGSWRTVEVEELRRRSFIQAVTAADLDGDGLDDLVVTYTSREGGVWRSGVDLFYAGPEETWERVGLHSVDSRSAYFAVAAGDLDGNGRAEVVVLDEEGGRLIFTQRGERRWAREASPEMAPLEQGCRGYHVVVVDLDGDGRDEIVEAFAGEPDPLMAPEDCRRRGGIQAWEVIPPGGPAGS